MAGGTKLANILIASQGLDNRGKAKKSCHNAQTRGDVERLRRRNWIGRNHLARVY